MRPWQAPAPPQGGRGLCPTQAWPMLRRRVHHRPPARSFRSRPGAARRASTRRLRQTGSHLLEEADTRWSGSTPSQRARRTLRRHRRRGGARSDLGLDCQENRAGNDSGAGLGGTLAARDCLALSTAAHPAIADMSRFKPGAAESIPADPGFPDPALSPPVAPPVAPAQPVGRSLFWKGLAKSLPRRRPSACSPQAGCRRR
jgi:hypothetical protein